MNGKHRTAGPKGQKILDRPGPVRAKVRGRLVFKAHRLVYHSTLGSRVIKKKKENWASPWDMSLQHRRTPATEKDTSAKTTV